ncbi:MAG TPA: TolC family protein [Bryobacteraceae bacterium]|nr:TolC family protein [Bryobacteraceae bacterium]
MRRRILIALVLAIPAVGQTPEARVSLRDLTSEAMKNNPEIVAAQKGYEAARQKPTQESSLPDPMVSLGYTSIGKPLPGFGLGTEPTANIGVMYSQEIPYPGKLKLRGEIASKEADATFQQYQAVQLSVISRLKQAYYRLQYTYAASDLLKRNRDLLNKLVSVTEDRYSVGKAAQQDVFKAQTQASILETRLVKLEQERASIEAEIDSILNRRPGTPVGRPDDVKPKELSSTLEELYASAAQNSPMLRRDQKMIERSELAVNSARKEYYPDMTLSGGYFNQGGMPPMYQFQASFKVPLFYWRKQRAGVNEQVSMLSQAKRTYEATDQSLHARIQGDFTLAQASAKLMKLYTQTVVPQGNLALESSLSTYETGSVDFLSVLTNFTTVLDYEMNYYDEALNYALALSRLEEMTGQPLTD